ncbi:hypothetical protein ZWY2020_054558 [Hordeum vulgare]|nr:hypothetical protein ZWY2020_054558 [Hordeum vulgare]
MVTRRRGGAPVLTVRQAVGVLAVRVCGTATAPSASAASSAATIECGGCLSNCRHIRLPTILRGCIDRWMGHRQRTCPLCRAPLARRRALSRPPGRLRLVDMSYPSPHAGWHAPDPAAPTERCCSTASAASSEEPAR